MTDVALGSIFNGLICPKLDYSNSEFKRRFKIRMRLPGVYRMSEDEVVEILCDNI